MIVCEGEKTEPNYFKSFKVVNSESMVYDVEAKGFGLNTVGVVRKAIELRNAQNRTETPYDAVWAVFDKDDFSNSDFDNAIAIAESEGINVAWSNEAFELWYLLHFQYRNTSMSREDYKNAISKAVNESALYKESKKYVYAKNDKQNFYIMDRYGNQEFAISNANKLLQSFEGNDFHKHNPCTTVQKLVLQLLNRDEELIRRVMLNVD